MVIWAEIKTDVCKATPENPSYKAYLTKRPVAFTEDRYWVIGPYKGINSNGLTTLAGDLRDVTAAQISFDKAWFGRFDDKSPRGSEQPEKGGYKTKMPNSPDLTPNFTPQQIAEMRKDGSSNPRKNEQYKVYRDYWRKTTLGAHHIVEKSILRTLGCNKNALHDDLAPCVLVSAEMHKWFSDQISTYRKDFTRGMNINNAVVKLTTMYTNLYTRAEMADLLKIAKIIIDHVQRGDLDYLDLSGL